MLIPSITYCQSNNCKSWNIYDTTGIYSIINPNGFGNPNISFSDINGANLIITDTANNVFSIDIINFFRYPVLAGRVNRVFGSPYITGYGTSFTTDVNVGDDIIIGGSIGFEVLEIDSIQSDTLLTVTTNALYDGTYDFFFDYTNQLSTDDVSNLRFDLMMTDFGSSLTNSFSDGIYNIVYKLEDSSGNFFSSESNFALYCNTECCVQHMVAQIPSYYKCNNCDNTFINKAIMANALLNSLKKAAGCGNKDKYNNIMGLLSKICNTTNCNNCN